MFTHTLLTLAGFSFELGLIGVDEYRERLDVIRWLDDKSGLVPDPRDASGTDKRMEDEESSSSDATETVGSPSNPNDLDSIEFTFRGEWVFTKSDPDPYPSTPHGHLSDPNRPWPKLNPYSGRVFKSKHQEDVSARLRRTDLIELWSSEKFRDFCRSYILWYVEQHPVHVFPVPHPLRFPRWR